MSASSALSTSSLNFTLTVLCDICVLIFSEKCLRDLKPEIYIFLNPDISKLDTHQNDFVLTVSSIFVSSVSGWWSSELDLSLSLPTEPLSSKHRKIMKKTGFFRGMLDGLRSTVSQPSSAAAGAKAFLDAEVEEPLKSSHFQVETVSVALIYRHFCTCAYF